MIIANIIIVTIIDLTLIILLPVVEVIGLLNQLRISVIIIDKYQFGI